MGWLKQCGVLVWKNLLLRKRKPVILLFELLWPLVVLAVVVVLKTSVSISKFDHCYYLERSLPSSGMVPFLQTFGCNLDQQCKSLKETEKRRDKMGSFSQLVSYLEPDFSKNSTVNALKNMDKTVVVVKALKDSAKDMPTDLDDMMQIRKLLKDPDYVKNLLVKDYKLFTDEVAEAILNASLNAAKLFEITGYIDFNDIVCDKDKLADVLLFAYNEDVSLVSEYLCKINSSYIPELTDIIVRELSISQILKIVQKFTDLRKEYDVSAAISDLRTMLDLIYDMPEIADFVKTLPPLEDLKPLLEKLPGFIEKAQTFSNLNLELVLDLLNSLDPLMSFVQVSPEVWNSFKEAASLSLKIQELLNNNFGDKMTKAKFGDLLSWDEATFVNTLEQTYNMEPSKIKSLYNSFVYVNLVQQASQEMTPFICSSTLNYMISTLNDMLTDDGAQRVLDKLQISLECGSSTKDPSKWSEFEKKIKDNSVWLENIKKYHQSKLMDTINGLIDITNSTMVKNNLLLKYVPMMADVDFAGTWKMMSDLFSGKPVPTEKKIENMKKIQNMLEATGMWNSTESILIMVDNYMYFAEMMYNMTTGIYWQTKNVLSNNAMNSTMHGLINLGPEVVQSVILGFGKSDVIQDLVYSKEDYQTTCKKVLKEYVKPATTELNNTLHNLLCNNDISALVNNLTTSLNYKEIQSKINTMIQTLTENLQQPSLKKIELSELYLRMETIYTKYSKFYSDIWSDLKKCFEFMENNGLDLKKEEWKSVIESMYEVVMKNGMREATRSAVAALEQMDQTLVNVSFWRTVKHSVTAANAMAKFVNKYLFLGNRNMTMEEFLAINSTRIYEFFTRTGKITPDVIEALKNSIIKPEKMAKAVLKTNFFTDKICNPIMVSSFLELPANSSVYEFDKYMCSLNWTEISEQSFFDDDMKLYKRELELLFGPERTNLPDIYVNWTEVSANMMLFMENSLELLKPERDMTSRWKSYGFDLNKIDMKLKDLFSAMESMTYDRSMALQNPFYTKMLSQDSTLYSKAMTVYFKFYNRLLSEINTVLVQILETKKFDVVDYLNSEELNKILNRTQHGPELMDVVFETMIYHMKNPSKAAELYNPDVLNTICTDLGVFEKYVIIPESSSLKSSYLQRIFCNLDVNITKLAEELNANPISTSITDYVEELTYLFQHENITSSNLTVNFTEIVVQNVKYTEYLESLAGLPVKVTFGGFENRMETNFTVYENKWNSFVDKIQEMYSGANLQSFIQKYSMDLAANLDNMFSKMDSRYATGSAIYNNYQFKLLKEARKVLQKINETKTFDVIDYLNSEELNKILTRSENNPALLEIILETIMDFMKNPSKPAKLTNMQMLEKLCSNVTVFEEFVVVPKSTNLTADYVQSVFCNKDYNATKLLEELKANPIAAAVDEYMTQLSTLMSQNATDVNITKVATLVEISEENQKITILIDSLIRSSVKVTFGGLENYVNSDMAVYENMWNKFVDQLKDTFTGPDSQRNIQRISILLQNMMSKLDPQMASSTAIYNNFNIKLLKEVNKVLQKINDTRTFDVIDYYNSKQLKKMLLRSQNDPLILEIVFQTLLQLIKKPLKAAELGNMEVLNNICVNVTVFENFVVIPKSTNLTSAEIQGMFCNTDVNITKLMKELNANPIVVITTEYLNQLMEMQNGSVPNINNVDMTEMMLVYERMSLLIEGLIMSPVTITYGGLENNISPNMTVYVEIWNNFVGQLEEIYTTGGLQSILSDLGPALNNALSQNGMSDIAQNTAANFNLYVTILKEMNSVLEKINETKTLDFFEIYKFDELEKTIKVNQHFPDVSEMIFNTMLKFMKNPGLTSELSSMAALEKLCSNLEYFQKIFVISKTSKLTPLELQDSLCNRNINITVLMEEMKQHPIAKAIGNYFEQTMKDTNLNMTADYSIALEENNKMTALITDIVKSQITFKFGNMSVNLEDNSKVYMEQWNNFVDELKMEFNRENDTLESILASAFNSTIRNMAWLNEVEAVQEYSATMIKIYSGIERALDKMVVVYNGTEYIMVEKLFQDTVAAKPLYTLLQKPGVLETVINSLNTDKFTKLFAMNNLTEAILEFCTNMDSYLSVPNYATLNVTLFRYEFCSINLTLLPAEMEQLFLNDDNKTMNATNNSNSFSKMMSLSQSFSNRIKNWIENPPIVIVASNPAWSNATYWMEFLMKYSYARQNTSDIAKEVENLLDKIKMNPDMDVEMIRKFGLVLETATTLVNAYLNQLMRTGNLTLSPKLFESFGLSPEIMKTITSVPLARPENLLALFYEDWQEKLCKYSFWEETFSFSKDVNITEIQMAFCAINISGLPGNKMKTFSLTELVSALQNPSVEPNWNILIFNSRHLQEIITDIINKPDFFSLENALKSLEKVSKTENLFGLMNLFTAIGKASKDDSSIKAVNGFIRVGTIVSEYLQSTIDKLTPMGSTLDLGSLLKNVTQIKYVLKTVANMDNDLITAFLGLKLNPAKAPEFSQIISNETRLASFLCSEKQMRDIFTVSDAVNIGYIVNVTCGFDRALLVTELKDAIEYDDLMMKIMEAMNSTSSDSNIQGYIAAVQKLSSSLLKFMNVTSVSLDEIDFSQLLNGFKNINYTALLMNLNTNNAQDIGYYSDMVEKFLVPVLNESSTGQEILAYLWTLNTWAKSFNPRLQRALDSGWTLGALFNQRFQMENLDTMFLAVANFDTLKSVTVNFTLMTEFMSDAEPKDRLCGTDLWIALDIPTEANETVKQLQEKLCSMNNTVMIWKSLMMTKDFVDLMTKISTMKEELQNINLASIDINETVRLLMQTSQLVQNMLKDFNFPDSSQMLNTTVVSTMMEKMMKLFQMYSATLWENWTTALVKMMAPDSTSAEAYLRQMAKYINSMNLFLEIANKRINQLKDTITMEDLAGNNTEILNVLKSVSNLQKRGAEEFSNGNVTWDTLINLMTTEDFANVCKSGNLAQRISPANTVPSSVAIDVANVVCATPQRIYEIIQNDLEISKLQAKLGEIWNDNYTGKADWQTYTNSMNTLNALVMQLIQNPPSIGSDVKDFFNFDNIMDVLNSSMNNPKLLLPALGVIGPVTSQMDPVSTSKYVNTMIVIMENVNRNLQIMKDNSYPELMNGNVTEFLNFLKSFVKLQYSFSDAILNGNISWSDVLKLLQAPNDLKNACGNKETFANAVNADKKFPVAFVEGIQSIFCVYPGTFVYAVGDQAERERMQKELSIIWSPTYSDSANWVKLFQEGTTMNTLITELIKNPQNNYLNFTDVGSYDKITEALKSVLFDPKMLLGVLGTALPSIPNTGDSEVARIVNTINVIIKATNNNIERMKNDNWIQIMADNGTALVELFKGLMNIQYSLNEALMQRNFDFEPMLKLFESPDDIVQACKNGTLAKMLDPNKTSVHAFATDVQTIVCSFPEYFVEATKDQMETQKQIQSFWSWNYTGTPEWVSLTQNWMKLDTLIMDMIKSSPPMNQIMSNSSMTFEKMLKSVMSVMSDPEYLSRQMQYYSYMLDNTMKDPGVNMAVQYVDRLVLAPFVKLMEDTKATGKELTWETMSTDKETAYKLVSGLLDQDTQMELIADSYIKPMINFLGSKNEIRTHVCSEKEEYSSWLCSQPADQWYKVLQDHKTSNSDIMTLTIKVLLFSYIQKCVIYVYKLIRYNFDTVLRILNDLDKLSPLQENPSMPPLSGSEVMKHVGKIQEYMQGMGSIENFSFDLLMNTTMEMMMKPSKQRFIAAFQLLETYGLMGESQKIFMENAVNSMDAVNDYLKDLLIKLNATGNTIPFTAMFSNVTRLSELLEILIGSPTAAEIMASSIRMDMMMNWSSTSFWVSSACDPVKFKETFGALSPDLKLDKIQKSLCNSFTKRADALSELVDLIKVGDIVKSLEALTEGRKSNSTGTMKEVMEAYYDQMMLMMDYIGKLTKYQFKNDKNKEWLAPLFEMFQRNQNASVERAVIACNNMISYMEYTPGMKEFIELINNVEIGFVSAKRQMVLNKDLNNVLCKSSKLNLTKIADVLNTKSYIKEIEWITSKGTNLTDRLVCSEFHSIISDIQRLIMETYFTDDNAFERMGKCMEDLPGIIENTLSDVDSFFQFAKEAVDLLGHPTITDLMMNEGMSKVSDFFLKILMQQKEDIIQFMDILKSSDSFESMLQQTSSLAPDMISRLLNSTLKLNVKKFLNISETEIEKLLCSSTELQNTIQIPGFTAEDYGNLVKSLCNENVSTLARGLKSVIDLSQLTIAINKMERSGDLRPLLQMLADDIQNIMKNVNGLNELLEMYNLIYVKPVRLDEMIPIIQRVLIRYEPDKIIDSVMMFIEHLEAANNDETVSKILVVVKKLMRGFSGLKLISYNIPKTVVIEEALQDPMTLRKYLQEELSFPPKIVTAILQSSINYMVLYNSSSETLTDTICVGKNLGTLLQFNNTDVDVNEISSTICSLNDSTLAEIIEKISHQLNIGKIVQRYVETSGSSIFEDSKLTIEEVKDVIDQMKDSEKELTNLSVKLKNNTLIEEMKNVMLKPEALAGALKLGGVADVICGTEIKVDDFFNLKKIYKRSISETPEEQFAQKSLRRRKRASSYLFRDNFCVQLMRSILEMDGGEVIWTYLKPLLLGRIPFAPNTPVTRKIMNEVNKAFEVVAEANKLAEVWSSGSKSLEELMTETNNTSEFQSVLDSKVVSSLLEQMIGIGGDELKYNIEALQSFDGLEINTLQTLAELIANYTSCIRTDRIEGYASEEELLKRVEDLRKSNSIVGAVVFTNSEFTDSSDNDKETVPKHIQYKLRFDIDNVPYTDRLSSNMWIPGPRDNYVTELRYLRGFLPLQDMIDRAIIDIQLGKSVPRPSLDILQMPHPCHQRDFFLRVLGEFFLPLVLTAAWVSLLGVATRILVYHRETGQEEMMNVMGLNGSLHTVIWFLSSMVFAAVLAIIYAVVFNVTTVTSYSNILIIFIDIILFSFSSLLMCYMVSAFFTRSALALLTALIVYLISYLPFLVLSVMQYEMTRWQKIIACLSSTTTFGFSAQYISRYELQQIGIQWDNIASSPLKHDNLNFYWMWIMMAIDGVIYFLIGWYVRNVKPGKFGVGQPWYFPVSPFYWNCGGQEKSQKYAPGRSQGSKGSLSEELPDNSIIGISLQGLSKSYNGKERVVKDLNLDFCEGDVTAMIGPNGASKSTIINMMVGILRPSAGQISMYGESIRNSKRCLGMCAQFNALIDYMTVYEHMEFYASFKTKSNFGKSRIDKDIRQILAAVNLVKYRNVRVDKLSGGMKRRLCVALAFVGGSDVIVLDEPTSGIDASARRAIWNLIIKNKSCRTIIVSTHHLDEADVIADRVAMVHEGNILACGSPLYLKKQIGSGYRLTIEKRSSIQVTADRVADSSQSSSLMRTIKSFVPQAYAAEEMSTELVAFLPVPEEEERRLPSLCSYLDANSRNLNIASYALSFTSLEEVFVKMSTTADSGQPLSVENLHNQPYKTKLHNDEETKRDSTIEEGSNGHILKQESMTERDSGCGHKLTQFGALLTKRFFHCIRNWKISLSVLILPVLFFLLATWFSLLKPYNPDMPSILLSPSMYGPETYSFYKDESGMQMASKMMSTFEHDPGFSTTCMKGDFSKGNLDYVNYKCVSPDSSFTRPDIFYSNASECRCTDYNQQCDKGSGGLPPKQMTTTTTQILQNFEDKNVISHLLDTHKQFIDKRYGGFTMEKNEDSNLSVKIWFDNKGYHSMPAYLNAYSNAFLRANIDPAKHGNPEDYGITVYNHPLTMGRGQLSMTKLLQSATDVGISIIILIAFTFVPAGLLIYTVGENIRKEKQLQLISGIGSTLYWIATFVWDLIIFSLPVGCAVIIIVAFPVHVYYDRQNLEATVSLLFAYGWVILPFMYVFLKPIRDPSAVYMVVFCINIFIGILTSITVYTLAYFADENVQIERANNILQYAFLIFPQYCLASGLIKLATVHMEADILSRFGEDMYKDPFTFEMIAVELIVMGAEGLVLFILTIFIDSKKSSPLKLSRSMSDVDYVDEDVLQERQRVLGESHQGSALFVQELSKVYRRNLSKFCAVDHISFGVYKGECFGLLGMNGAGKTTTFRILTGDVLPSSGRVILNGKKMEIHSSKIGRDIGYCPQEDALDNYLTGRRLLYFYAKLRGIPSDNLNKSVEDIIAKLQLGKHADRVVRHYSGGMKRKLSVCIAMLGNPSVIYLDEPTTGMDPSTKRLVWNCISDAVKAGQSVVLTSHSMEECDILCDRLAIMANGQFKCIGTPQHLKERFGGGYTVQLHLHGLSVEKHLVKERLMSTFHGAQIVDQHEHVLQINIPRDTATAATIFNVLQKEKHDQHITQYSVSQTTLEDVFLNFSQEKDGLYGGDSDSSRSASYSSGGSSDEQKKSISASHSTNGSRTGYTNPVYQTDETIMSPYQQNITFGGLYQGREVSKGEKLLFESDSTESTKL